MSFKSAVAAAGIAVAVSMTPGLPGTPSAEAGWGCRGPAGWCGPQPVRHFLYFPNYYNTYYMATFAPDPYPYVYMPRGYWPRYERPYSRYQRRYWTPRRAYARGCYGGCVPAPGYIK